MKKCITTILLLLSTAIATCQDTDWSHEWKTALDFLTDRGIDAQGMRIVYTSDNLICFSSERSKNFCIVAKEPFEPFLDSPILAYGPDSQLGIGNNNESSATIDGILENYSELLSKLKENESIYSSNLSSALISGRAMIKPLTDKIRYGQKTPYNNLFPEETLSGGVHEKCVAGCGPVALAQVISYYRYPDKPSGTGMITMKQDNINIAMDRYRINWNTDKDIPILMLNCAASLSASVSSVSTTSSIDNFKSALICNWGYSPQCMTVSDKPDAELLETVYRELDSGRPVIAAGSSHIFICDGYDRDYIHINWGWDGNCNGYFRTFTADSTSVCKLPFQKILIGIRPATDSISATIRVDVPGSLARMIDRKTMDGITSLTIYGTLNGTDIQCLRNMAGAPNLLQPDNGIGSLMHLDLSHAVIEGGLPYATYYADGYVISGTMSDSRNGEFHYRYNMSDITDEQWKTIIDNKLNYRGDMLLRRDTNGRIYISYYAQDNVIGKRMFGGCQNLRSIKLPVATQRVDDGAFFDCRSLEKIYNLPDIVHENAFSECIHLNTHKQTITLLK